MSEETSTRKEVYEILYNNLTRIQDFYRELSTQCSQHLWQSELSNLPFCEKEESYREELEEAHYASVQHSRNIETIKYKMGLAVLTEGGLISETDLTETIGQIDKMLDEALIEGKGNNTLKKWTNSKIKYLNDTRNILLQILEHKLVLKIKFEKAVYQ